MDLQAQPPSHAAYNAAKSSTQLSTSLNPMEPSETPHDLFCLAKEYERRGRLPDAANLYLRASMNGHLKAMVCYASHLVHSDERAAFVWFRAAAERGDPRAWAELGQLLARGRYFEVNPVDAARCWKRAAQMGDNTGKSALGLCYIRGFGVKKDAQKGVEIVRQVADVHNDVTAMKNLAWIYRHGKGVPKNLDEAHYWDSRAKKQETISASVASREASLFGKARSSSSVRRAHERQQQQEQSPQEQSPQQHPQQLHDTHSATVLVTGIATTTTEPPAQEHHQSPQPPSYEEPASPECAPQPVDAHVESETEREVEPQVVSQGPVHEPELQYQSQFSFAQHDNQQSNEAALVAAAAIAAGAAASAPYDVAVSGSDHYEAESLQSADVTVSDDVHDEQYASSSDVDQQQEEHYDVQPSPPKPNVDASVEEERSYAASPELSESEQKQPDAFDISVSEIRAVEQTAASQAEQEKPITSISTIEVQQQPQPVVSPEEIVARATSPSSALESSLDEHFATPEQSLDSERYSTSQAKPAVVPAAFGATSTALATGFEETSAAARESAEETLRANIPGAPDLVGQTAGDEQSYEDEEVGESEGQDNDDDVSKVAAVAAGVFGAGVAVVAAAKPDSGAEDADEESEPSRYASPFQAPEISSLAPAVREKALLFENNAAGIHADVEEEDDEMRQSASYALGAGNVDAGNLDLKELDNVDVASLDAAPTGVQFGDAQKTYTPEMTTSCSITRARIFPKDETSTPASPRPFDSELSSSEDVEAFLLTYPEYPTKLTSQETLFKFCETIQNVPLSNSETYASLVKGFAFEKVVVAMLTQNEDEAIQDQGLHSLIRILRSSQPPLRPGLILSEFGDCYRRSVGDEHAVVPKGHIGVDEKTSGAIQAIIHAMRTHPEVRRVQLAGCAGLAEVAAASNSCRSIAYDKGAVGLIINAMKHRSTTNASSIHDMASRATSAFCYGKENFAYKEAFTNASVIPELLSILRLWGHADDVKSEIISTATKSACGAVRHVTDGCAVASAQCVQSFAYHNLVRVMVLRREDVSVCTLVVSALTSITRNAGSQAEKGLLDAKPLPEVLITMQKHANNPLFIRKALDFMESLGTFNSMRDEIVRAGGIPFAADIIEQGGSDTLLLERACGVAEKLCLQNQKNQETFSSHNGVKSLTKLLDSHKTYAAVVERDLLAMISVCSNFYANQIEAMNAGAPQQLVHILNTYTSRNAKIVAAATGAISAMVVPKNTRVAQSFAQLNAPELVVSAMKKHPDNVSVQENGSSALSAFCEADPKIVPSLLKTGISSILVVALQRYLHKQTAVVQIARAMRALINEENSEESYRFKSKLLTDRSNGSSLSEIFHTALSYHKKSLPDTANVIISICATINRLCMRSVAFKNEVGKDGIVEELKKLFEKTAEYRDLGALQPVLATICTLLLESEENKNKFHAVGGVEAILDVMQKWKSDTFVLEHCCAALRYSCNEHFGNCDEVKHHNGVRSILGVMELHPENVNVILWCCLTLADLCRGDEELQNSPEVVQGIRKVVSAMGMFSNNSRFLASACEFLRATSLDNAENQERIVRLGGRTAIVKALEAHPGDNTLTESGSYALLQVQDIVDSRASVDGGGSFGLVRRLSRELRRSGSQSSRSNRGSKSRLGRKSLSFSSKRRATNAEDDALDAEAEAEAEALNQTVAEETPATRQSLFSRVRSLGRSKSSRRKAAEESAEDEGPEEDAQEDYDDYEPPTLEADEEDSDPQLE